MVFAWIFEKKKIETRMNRFLRERNLFILAVFLLDSITMLLYHGYICTELFPREGKNKKYPVRVWLIVAVMTVSMLLVVLNNFNHMYYYFDNQNYYHRNTWFPLSLLLGLFCGIIELTLIIQYGKKISKGRRFALMSYIILPMIATVILVFFYGISLVNISMTISVLFMHITAVLEQGRQLQKKEKEMYQMQVAIM